MARKVVNRKELREEAEAAEAAGAGDAAEKKTAKKKATKRKSRAKDAAAARMMLFWGVYNQSLKLVAKYAFNQKKEAEKKAEQLSTSAKSPHFVQKVKEAIEE